MILFSHDRLKILDMQIVSILIDTKQAGGYMGESSGTDKTTHRHGFLRQFIDTIEDYSSTLFEDNSSTHYYLAIIRKLIK